MQNKEKSKAPAVDSTMMILDLLASADYPLTLSEICQETGIAAASGHRIINTMLEHQIVALDPSRKKSYCVGSKIFQIASTIYNKQNIIPFFYPIAEILKNEIHKSIFLCVPIGNKVVVVSKIESSLSSVFNIYVGQTMPLHLSASGKTILAMRSPEFQDSYFKSELKLNPLLKDNMKQIKEDLERTKRLGYAVTDGEIGDQVSCIATPILNLRNEAVAAISAGILCNTLSPQDARNYSKNMVQAARQLSARIV
jgi:DNA-binding IclR family transcriptional regulator